MHCAKCGAAIEEGKLYCTSCGDKFAVNEQRARVNQASANVKGIITKQMHTPIFLAVAICFSVMAGFFVLPALFEGIWSIVAGILPIIFMVITVVGLWCGYTAKDTSDVSKILRQVSIYDAFSRVVLMVAIVLLSILAGLSTVLLALTGAFLGNALAESDLDPDVVVLFTENGIIVAVIVLVVFLVAITLVAIIRDIYKRRRAYFCALAYTAEKGVYNIKKAPVIASYILGGWNVIAAIGGIAVPAVVQAIFGDLLADFGGEFVGGVVTVSLASSVLSGFSGLVLGAYFILSAIWMSDVHKAELANKAVIEAELAALEQIENQTKDAIFKDDIKKRQEEEANKAASQKAQVNMQEQQQMMMQMMMQQMMQSGIMPNMANMMQQQQSASQAPQSPFEPTTAFADQHYAENNETIEQVTETPQTPAE